MRKILIITLLFIAFQSKAQISTTPKMRNTDPLSKIQKVSFDTLTSIITVFDGKDSWDFKPMKSTRMKEGYEVKAQSGFETFFFMLKYSDKAINYIAAYSDKSMKKMWSIE